MNRREILGVTLTGVGLMAAASPAAANPSPGYAPGRGAIITSDGVRLAVKDYGEGPVILFASAWCFTSDAWGAHIEALAQQGFRCIAYDRRGHGRSEDPGRGYDADTLADDFAAVLHGLNLERVTIVAHSMGAIEAVRYIGRHNAERIARLILVAPATPYLARTADNPRGIPAEAFDAMRAAMATDFPQWLRDNEAPFFLPKTSAALRDWTRRMMESVSLPVALACHRVVTATDCRQDLARIDRPVLIIQGDKDASLPLAITGEATHTLVPRSHLMIYDGAPHGLPLTHADRLISDIIRQTR